MTTTKIILASQSPYRKQLFQRLGLAFDCQSPNINEQRLDNENLSDMVTRLAEMKATTIAKNYPNALIIASDQSAEHQGNTLGKPGNFNRALEQLSQLQGHTVIFHTSLCLLTPTQKLTHTDHTVVTFRQRSLTQLTHYLAIEKPYDCAGAFKSEGLGVTLLESIQSQDPSALIGLPLITLANWLTELGYLLPDSNQSPN